ncbi:hypothetical protein B0T18DRAFT_434844 [Schizothecium vesticola]|uniref:Uncharacterized protein n=1 Tax=Schizothecium vesticola TaxID=314040 RepID=A0AA40KD39_9PEZI|nr:hypothetical protein B0T18DRAFT_434844 [Schizothecium vesticola]
MELLVERLEKARKYQYFAGSKRPVASLHLHISIGRNVVITERMDLHLLWSNNETLFIKPMPRFLLDSGIWNDYLTCQPDCAGYASNETALQWRCPQKKLHWKKLVRKILAACGIEVVLERFHRGELRLSRLNTIHRFTQWPPFNPYFRTWRYYGDIFYGNLTWMATVALFIVLDNDTFISVSYSFSIFAIIGLMGAFGLMLLVALYNLLKDLPHLPAWDGHHLPQTKPSLMTMGEVQPYCRTVLSSVPSPWLFSC